VSHEKVELSRFCKELGLVKSRKLIPSDVSILVSVSTIEHVNDCFRTFLSAEPRPVQVLHTELGLFVRIDAFTLILSVPILEESSPQELEFVLIDALFPCECVIDNFKGFVTLHAKFINQEPNKV